MICVVSLLFNTVDGSWKPQWVQKAQDGAQQTFDRAGDAAREAGKQIIKNTAPRLPPQHLPKPNCDPTRK